MSGDITNVLYASEAEAYIQTLEAFDVKDVGSPRWTQQHEYLEKLNIQAIISASQHEDEFCKEFFISYEKIRLLIHDLVVTDIWKRKVFPEFVRLNLKTDLLFPVYMVLYHEATVANLLETLLYHRDACEQMDDRAVDLIDYCCRKLTPLISRIMCEEDIHEEEELPADLSTVGSTNCSSLDELQRLEKKLNFDICMKTVSILRYLTDHLSALPVSAATRMLNKDDVPVLLVQLVLSPPWLREKSGKTLQYVDSKWKEITSEDRFKLNKLQGQVWIALFQLLLSEHGQQSYELNSTRKMTLLKLRSHLNELLLDQMPILVELLRYLEHLAVMEPPPVKRDLIIEQLPEIWESFERAYKGKWGRVAKKQSETYFNADNVNMKESARKLAETYSNDILESLIADPPKCAACGELATKRCSRCQNEWYCRRECQVQHWSKHKKACDLMADSVKRNNELLEEEKRKKIGETNAEKAQ